MDRDRSDGGQGNAGEGMGMAKRASRMSEASEGGAGMALGAIMFAPGKRPAASALAALGTTGGFTISHLPPGEPHWAELLRNGLTFDLCGLAPGAASPLPPAGAEGYVRAGLANGVPDQAAEVLVLHAGPHLAGAESLLPVVRTAVEIMLALLDDAVAVAWLPARTLVSPRLFADAVKPWLAGGAFPAIALAGLVRDEGQVRSTGLTFFVGQDFALSGRDGAPAGEAEGRAALRLVDWIVAHGPVREACQVDLAGGGSLWLEPQDSCTILGQWI